MRKQYHFRPSRAEMLIWDVDRLVELSKELPRKRVALSAIREIDEVYWFHDEDDPPTCRAVVEHLKRIREADLAFPIILSAGGRVMDGMHRVLKALWEGRADIEAVQFECDPAPGYVDRRPKDLPY